MAIWTVAPAEYPTPTLYKVEGIREQARALHIVSVWRGGLANADFLALGSWEKQWKVSVLLSEFWGTGKDVQCLTVVLNNMSFPHKVLGISTRAKPGLVA